MQWLGWRWLDPVTALLVGVVVAVGDQICRWWTAQTPRRAADLALVDAGGNALDARFGINHAMLQVERDEG
jgi:Co/Zn/Cd efflux system component